MTYEIEKEKILDAPDVPFAAKRIIRDNDDRDVYDVLNDLEMLHALFSKKLENSLK